VPRQQFAGTKGQFPEAVRAPEEFAIEKLLVELLVAQRSEAGLEGGIVAGIIVSQITVPGEITLQSQACGELFRELNLQSIVSGGAIVAEQIFGRVLRAGGDEILRQAGVQQNTAGNTGSQRGAVVDE